MKIVSIHQPSYFPWLGLLDKINKSDTFILMDNVQLSDRAYQHRNIFLNNQGLEHMLTIPINKKNYRSKAIKELTVSDIKWQKKHSRFLIDNYKKYPFFDEIYEKIEFIYEKEYTYLIDILVDSMSISYDLFGIDTKIILQSDLNYNINNRKEELILDILDALNEPKLLYLSGTGAKDYQKENEFKKKNILLKYQKFIHPTYTQYKGKNSFIGGLSGLDILFNIGIEESKKILQKGIN